MCKLIGKSKDRILCKLSKSEILRLYSIVHVAMETTKTSHFTCQSKSFISVFFTCQVSACEQQPFSCRDLENDIYSQTPKTVFSHLYVDSDWKKQYLLTLRGEDSIRILSLSYLAVFTSSMYHTQNSKTVFPFLVTWQMDDPNLILNGYFLSRNSKMRYYHPG